MHQLTEPELTEPELTESESPERGPTGRGPTEVEQVRLVAVQLSERFPTVDREVIAEIVAQEHQRLDGPVRTFVPLLVQRTAGARVALLRVTLLETESPALVPA